MQNDRTACHNSSQSATHEHQSFERATEALSADHRVIETVLDALEKLAQNLDSSALEHWAKALDFIRNFADKCHHLKEEKLLFPALEERGIPREGGPIGMMVAEHEEGRGYVRAMAAALEEAAHNPGARQILSKEAIAYIRLLREHIWKEDEVLFHMADGVLNMDEHQQLLRDFEEHELRELGAGFHESYLRIAGELA
jgi:hemerythrin-like domain-containing protein